MKKNAVIAIALKSRRKLFQFYAETYLKMSQNIIYEIKDYIQMLEIR